MPLTKRTIVIGTPHYLHLHQQQMKIVDVTTEEIKGSIPIEDIGILLLDHPQVTLTHALLQALIDNNVAFISCDKRHLPSGLILNLSGHSQQAERFSYQINASDPLKKQLWQQTVYHKITNQAAVLDKLNIENRRLLLMLRKLQSGDSSNVEGQAAALYWKLLFGKLFLRDRYGDTTNMLLNYCYTIVRATMARALVGSGLLPTLGIFHHNKYNAYALADDIMEPYRPIADLLVYQMVQSGNLSEEITKEQKQQLLTIETVDVIINKRRSPFMSAIGRTTASLAECFSGKRRRIIYPEIG